MGNYTTFEASIVLKPDTPEDIKVALAALMSYDINDVKTMAKPDHPFWKSQHFSCIGAVEELGDPPCYDFPRLNIKCELKNYEQEIQKFLSWLLPHIETISGEYHYEEYYHPSTVTLGTDDSGEPAIHIAYPLPESCSAFGFEDDQAPKFRIETITKNLFT